MPLFGSRGGQPFYLAYQATPFPEIGAPVGLSGLAATMAPATSKKSSSSSSGKEDEGAGNTLFPGTTGVVKQINSLDNNNKLIESTIENVLSNKLEEAMKSGKDFSQFMEDEDVQGVVKQYQELQYMQSQIKDLAPISNTDYRQIEATREIAKENKSGNTLAMKKVGSVYMPVQTLGDNERIHMSTIDEYLSRESEREDKIKVDKDGKVTYDKSYLPPVVDVTGEWQKATDELGARAKMSSSGGIGTQVFESEPGNPLSQIAYLTNVESGSNFGAIRAAATSLSDSMTDPQLQSLDADIHRDIEAGDAKIFDVDEKGNITGTRYINEQERSDIRRVLTNDFEGVPDEEKERAWNVYQNTIMNGRAVKINERLAVQKQSESKVSAGSKLWDKNSGEGLPKNEGEFYMSVAQNRPPDNLTIQYGNDGSIKNMSLNRSPKNFGLVRTPGGMLKAIRFTGEVWNGASSKDVAEYNKKLTDMFVASNGLPAITLGPNVVTAEGGSLLTGIDLSKLTVLATTGQIISRIMPQKNKNGVYDYPVFNDNGKSFGATIDLTNLSEKANQVYMTTFNQNKHLGPQKAAEMAEASKTSFMKNNMQTPVSKTEEYTVVVNDDYYDDLDSDTKELYDIYDMPDPRNKEKTIHVMRVAAEVPTTMYLQGSNDYTGTQKYVNTEINKARINNQ